MSKKKHEVLNLDQVPEDEPIFRISAVARITGISTSTIRYYESQGLLERRSKEKGKHRYYSKRDIERIKRIQKLRKENWETPVIRYMLESTKEK
ncbi:MerR family transcriptional regulator [Calderihabitans maritimus]|uniref:MerR family transcriptional regulator n=1 Tax=Calderihabitans maritimus TaxID=1246530 RepID=A0A1Z5HTM9_9FIRM|nr:MerR family transcriptional regulator [Calderihabitans maritimus]GAW92778.1 MerR family transcriptional regulator [Calderihabitans maritimus]